jgi:hypothetical protein
LCIQLSDAEIEDDAAALSLIKTIESELNQSRMVYEPMRDRLHTIKPDDPEFPEPVRPFLKALSEYLHATGLEAVASRTNGILQTLHEVAGNIQACSTLQLSLRCGSDPPGKALKEELTSEVAWHLLNIRSYWPRVSDEYLKLRTKAAMEVS